MVNMNKVNENNTNYILSMLYTLRDRVSIVISSYEWIQGANLQVDYWSSKYDEIVDDIEELCEFRRYHNCLTIGEGGYQEININHVCNYNFTENDYKELGFDKR